MSGYYSSLLPILSGQSSHLQPSSWLAVPWQGHTMLLLSLLLPLLLLFTPLTRASTRSPPSPSPPHTITTCSRYHMVEAVKSSSHCHPMLKVVKLDIPGNGSYTQVSFHSFGSKVSFTTGSLLFALLSS